MRKPRLTVAVAITALLPGTSATAATTRSLVAVNPARLLDTRPTARVQSGGVIRVSVAGRGGVPSSGAGAVAVNVTAVQPSGSGFVTVYASGTPRPMASNLNFVGGQIVPNLVLTKIGADGAIDLFTSMSTHLVVDVDAWFPTGEVFHPTDPERLLDTRPGSSTIDGRSAGAGVTPAAGVVRVAVTGRGGVPSTGVAAVAVNVTAVEPRSSGFVTVFAAGSGRPLASNLNVVADQIVPNLVIAGVGTGGAIDLYTSAATHLVVDVMGWFPTGGSLNATTPARLLDTRPAAPTTDGIAAGGGQVHPGGIVRVPVAGRGGVPTTGASAVVVNVTAAEPRGSGFVTVYASGAPRPFASNLNVVAHQVVPNLVVAALGSDGRIELFASTTTHLIVDVMAWFPPDPASAPPPPPPTDEVWVSPGASPGGDGSAGRPLPTLQAALDRAPAGTTIRLTAGDHPGKSRTVRAGTHAAPIRIVGSPGARLRHDGTSRLLEIAHSNVTVEDLELSDANVLVTVIGASGVRLLRNSFHDAGSECIRIRYQSTDAEVANNVIRRCGLTGFGGSSTNGEGIYIGTAPERLGDNPTTEPDHSDRAWVHGNDIAVLAECVEMKEDADDALVERNLCVGGQYQAGAGLASRGHRAVFRANTSTGHLGSGIMLTGDRATDGTGSIIEHNTFTNNGEYGLKNVDRAQARMCANVLTGNGRGPSTPAAAGADAPC